MPHSGSGFPAQRMHGHQQARPSEIQAALALLGQLDGDVLWDEPLAAHSTLGVGGPVAAWFCPNTRASLIEATRIADRASIPVFAMGGGSNVLFPDGRVEAVAIHTGNLDRVRLDAHEVLVETGVSIQQLLAQLHEQDHHQLSFLAGIPGTVGGALVGNAGTADHWIGDTVRDVEVLCGEETVRWLGHEECRFGYRTSGLGRPFVILGAHLRIDGENFDEKEILSHKRATQPIGARTAGCVFRNPDTRSAGKLIEEAGLKGARIGNVRISEKHANFIENLGGARSAEIRYIIDIVREKVYKFHRVLLELEIEVFDGWTREGVQAKPSGGDL